MKTWTAPNLTELDVRLTEKTPGKVERIAAWGSGEWLNSTYAANDSPIPGPSDPSLAS